MNWNTKIILHPAFKGDILWHFAWPPCWKGKNHILVTWPATNLLISRKWCRFENHKSLLFCLKYDPLIVFRRQNHIACIFIKTMSHDLLAQLAYFIGTSRGSSLGGESTQVVESQSLSTTVLYPEQHWSTSSCKTYFVRRNWRIAPINPWLA